MKRRSPAKAGSAAPNASAHRVRDGNVVAWLWLCWLKLDFPPSGHGAYISRRHVLRPRLILVGNCFLLVPGTVFEAPPPEVSRRDRVPWPGNEATGLKAAFDVALRTTTPSSVTVRHHTAAESSTRREENTHAEKRKACESSAACEGKSSWAVESQPRGRFNLSSERSRSDLQAARTGQVEAGPWISFFASRVRSPNGQKDIGGPSTARPHHPPPSALRSG